VNAKKPLRSQGEVEVDESYFGGHCKKEPLAFAAEMARERYVDIPIS
jgi:hypothetical protein